MRPKITIMYKSYSECSSYSNGSCLLTIRVWSSTLNGAYSCSSLNVIYEDLHVLVFVQSDAIVGWSNPRIPIHCFCHPRIA